MTLFGQFLRGALPLLLLSETSTVEGASYPLACKLFEIGLPLVSADVGKKHHMLW